MISDAIRRLLLDRLQVIGVAADPKNDEAAVRAVCAELKVDLSSVVRELTMLRAEEGRKMMQRMGGRGLNLSRDALLGQETFDATYRKRSRQEWQELLADLDLGDLRAAFGDEPPQDPPARRHGATLAAPA
jgi:hypothetical protein